MKINRYVKCQVQDFWQTEKKPYFWPIKSLFSFSTPQTEKILGENCGKQDSLFGDLMSQAG